MRTWFSRRTAPADRPEPLDAYKEGSVDERRRLEKEGVGAEATRRETDRAYERGRHDERRRHHGHPFIALILIVLSISAIGMMYLAVRTGSFAAAGATVDRAVSSASQGVQAPVRNAAGNAGSALQNAGQSLKQRAGAGQP
jgi:hypothetical protein